MELFGKRGLSTPTSGPMAKTHKTEGDEDMIMPQAASSEAGKAAQQNSRRKEEAGDRKATDMLKTILVALSTLTLGMARELALVKSIVITCVLIANDKSEIPAKVMETTLGYSKHVDTLTREEKASFCSPHIMVWNTLIDVVKTLAFNKGMKEQADVIARYQGQMTAAAIAEAKAENDSRSTKMTDEELDDAKSCAIRANVAKHVKVCRVAKCWNPLISRVELMTTAGSEAKFVEEAVIKVLIQLVDGDVKEGQAPRGKLERTLQLWLNKVKNGKGKGKGKASEGDLVKDLEEITGAV